ncbi:MAG: metal ABC transporter permease [Acidimicrobiales bacterium]
MPVPPTAPGLSWNPLADVAHLVAFPFMVHALLAGAVVAVTASLVGWFVVLRRQVFAAHSLSVVAFPGAAGATLVGISAGYGFFAFAVAGAVVMAAAGSGRRRPGGGGGGTGDQAVIGTVQALALASGFLFAALYRGFLTEVTGLLFGSFLGVTATQVAVLSAVGLATVAVLAFIGRPLLFASLDPDVAGARGVPVGAVGVVFLVLVGVAAAEASQITGALLVFALLVLPPATAQRLTAAPAASLGLGVAIALAVTWGGLAAAYWSNEPAGFTITTLAFAGYVASGVRARSRPPGVGTGLWPNQARSIRSRVATSRPAARLEAGGG